MTGTEVGRDPFSYLSADESNDPFSHLSETREALAAEAQGLEHITYGVGAGLKAFGDAVTNMGMAAFKGMAALESGIQGKGFAEGWDSVNRMSEQGYGTTDPSILDVWHGAGLTDLTGKQADETINKRLGSEAIAWQTVGNLASFMVGPGAAVAQGGAKVAAPLAGFAERAIGRAVSRGTPGAAEALKTGKVWEFLAKSPEWQKTAGILARTGAFAGRHTGETIQVAAANAAQSGLMTPDDQKVDAALMAGALAPFMLPIARAGERLGGLVMQGGMDDAMKRNLLGGYRALERGDIGLEQLDDIVKANTGWKTRALGQTFVAPAIEGSAFMFLDPHAREEAQKWLAGDSDAGSRLLAMWLGTAVGVAASKHMVPNNLIPFFKAVRPEANSLQTWIDAETNKQLAREKFKQEQQEPEPSKDLPEGWEKLSPEELEGVKQKLHAAHADWSAAQNKRRPIEQQVAARAQEIGQQKQAYYGWAEGPALGMLRSGWEPEFSEGGVVSLRFGRDHSINLSRDEAGQPKLQFGPQLESILQDFGIKLPETDRHVIAPALIEYRGAAAKKALDDLTLAAMARRLNGDMTYQRLGMTEVMPGVWKDGNGKLHQMQLDGSTATKESIAEGKWTGKEDLAATGSLEGPQWTNETVEQLKGWLLRKFADNPDPTVDSILGQAIALAHNGQSFGAEQMRQFFETVPFEALAEMTSTPEGYRMLALELGSLASGHHNARDMAVELMQQAQKAMPTVAPDERAEFIAAQEGVPPTNPEGIRANEQEAFRQAMEEGAQANALSLGEKLLKSERPPEPGVIEAGSGGGSVLKALGRGIKNVARRAYDFAVSDTADVLQRRVPNDKLGYELRKVRGEGARLKGEALEKWRAAEQAAKGRGATKEGKAEAKQIREGLIKSTRTQGAEYSRSRLLADRTIEPENPSEKTYQESEQAAGKFAYEETRKAGGIRVNPKTGNVEAMPKRDRSFTPYQPGADSDKVYADPALRRRWHEVLVSENPGKMVPKIGKNGDYLGEQVPLTADWLETNWGHEQKRKHVPGEARESAAEHVRFLENVPDVWEGREMLETDVFRRASRTLSQQAARAATLREYGPQTSAAQRAAMLKEAAETGTTNPAIEAIKAGKFGVTERLERFTTASLKQTMTPQERGRLIEVARGALVRAQGGNPEQPWALTEMLRDYVKASSSAMSAGAFVLDIPEPIFRTAALVGFKDTFTALREIARNPKEMMQLMEQLGAIDRQVAEMSFDESSKWVDKFSDFVQIPGSLTERGKGLWNAVIAHNYVEMLRAGTAPDRVRDFVFDVGKLSPEQMAAIDGGRMTAPLANQLRRELTQFFTSRSRPGEGSRLAASSNAGTILRFTRWATKRIESTVQTARAVGVAAKRDGWNSKATGRAVMRLLRVQGGMALGGMAGQTLAYMLTSMMRGENPMEGAKRLMDEFSYAPAATLGKAWRNQLVGGPFAQLINAFIENKDAEGVTAAAAKSTVPGQIFYALADATLTVAEDPKDPARLVDAAVGAAYDAGLIPLRSQLRGTMRAAQAAWNAEDPQVLADDRMVQAFDRMEGIERPRFEKNKPEAFYDAIAGIMRTARSMPNAEPKEVLNAAMEDVRKALALAPEESVAAAIEGRMRMRGRSDEEREKLHRYSGDADQIRRLYQMDRSLKELAREVGKLEGTHQSTFQDELARVQQQARYGGGDRWRGLMQRVTDEAAQTLLAGDGPSPDIEDLAEAMAAYPEQLDGLFDKATWRFLQSEHPDSTAKARRIAAVLRSRARDRVRTERREAAREAADAR